jgi:predicted RNA-binding Zn ribbon-like protein
MDKGRDSVCIEVWSEPSTGEQALALAATLVVVRPGEEIDLLDGPGALARWLEEHTALLGDPGPDTSLRVAEFRALRDAVRGLLAAPASGEPLSPDAVRRVNEASASVPRWPVLDAAGPGPPRILAGAHAGSRTGEILATIARSAIHLLGGPERERLRVCPAPRCGRIFVSARPGAVWCSPAHGNRVRVARFHAKRRDANDATLRGSGPPSGPSTP